MVMLDHHLGTVIQWAHGHARPPSRHSYTVGTWSCWTNISAQLYSGHMVMLDHHLGTVIQWGHGHAGPPSRHSYTVGTWSCWTTISAQLYSGHMVMLDHHLGTVIQWAHGHARPPSRFHSHNPKSTVMASVEDKGIGIDFSETPPLTISGLIL
ncbi:hypothetical protein Btru_032433 [Bulinus truncatus]|nr:hypothetical protein Btru_032433 [Bulinus truncatus]